jgi:hypothetical protein
MRWQLAAIGAIAACGSKGDSGGGAGSAGCPVSRFAVEISDDRAPLMKTLYDRADQDQTAQKVRVYPQLDEWKDGAGVKHTAYRLAGSNRASIEGYIAVRLKDDPKLAVPADRAIRYEKTLTSGPPYWRTHYVVVPPLLDGTAIASAEVSPSGIQIVVRLTEDARAKLASATAAHLGTKLTVRAGDTVMAAPAMPVPFDDRLLLATAEDSVETGTQVAAEITKRVSCAP